MRRLTSFLFLLTIVVSTGCACGHLGQFCAPARSTGCGGCGSCGQCCYNVVDPTCYGYYPTCWKAWPDACAPCPPPGAAIESAPSTIRIGNGTLRVMPSQPGPSPSDHARYSGSIR